MREAIGLGQHVLGQVCAAQKLIEHAVQAGGGTEHLIHHTHQYHSRNEMRHIGDRLHGLFEFSTRNGIQEQSKENGDGKIGNQGIDGDAQGVGNHALEVVGFEKFLKMREPYPGAAPDALHGIEFFKGNLNARHGNVLENDQIGEREQQEDVYLPILPHSP